MKYIRIPGLVVGTFLIFSIASVNVGYNSSNEMNKKGYVYKGPDGYLYELASVNGPSKGIATKNVNIDFNFKKITKGKRKNKLTDIDRLESLIYSSRVQLDLDSVNSAGNYITSDILQNLSGRLLFGSR